MRVAIWGALSVVDIIAGHRILGALALLLLLGCATPRAMHARRGHPDRPATTRTRDDHLPHQTARR
jgi:hypothetical protein